MFLISSCSCLCSFHWSQVLSQEWRCSWSSADRQCSNYIWVINTHRRVQGCGQGTIVSASDLHNVWENILNPFYNMEYKMIKKIRQTKTWIEADIPSRNLTLDQYNALALTIVYVSNDVTIPVNSITSQMNTIATQRILQQVHLNEIEIVLKSMEWRSNITILLAVQRLNHWCLTVFMLRLIRWDFFSKICILLLPILKNNNLQC